MPRTTSAPLRLTQHIREMAKHLADERGVSEASVYRQIIEGFFYSYRQQTVDQMETDNRSP